jgi:anti-anti-sigma factor
LGETLAPELSQYIHLGATKRAAVEASFHIMRVDNSTAASPAATTSHTARGGSEPCVPEKTLKVSLESANFGSAVVLHCHDRAILRDEGRVLASLIAEVLPSARRMVVNLEAVHSIDSGALGELVMIHMWAEAAGYALPFASPSDAVRGLLESTNLVSVFDVYASVEAAVTALRQEQVQTA